MAPAQMGERGGSQMCCKLSGYSNWLNAMKMMVVFVTKKRGMNVESANKSSSSFE